MTGHVHLVPTLRMYEAVSTFSVGLRNILLDVIALANLSL